MEQRQVQQRQVDSSGDYEYDEAHGQAARGAPGHTVGARPAPAPAGRLRAEPDGDMSYDEAHDF